MLNERMTKKELLKRVKKNQMKASVLEEVEKNTRESKQKLWEEHQLNWINIQNITEKVEEQCGCPGYFQEEIALLKISFNELMQEIEAKIADCQKKKAALEAELDDLIEIGRQLEHAKK
ncbi:MULTISPECIES: hypothetical protein [Listeria]|uniref:hypothetical protein n=1 Tax=Listeria TaxID=1637 RepID=UPI000B590B10|nr:MULTISPECIES: hypothetical protein [Listeria]